MNTSLLHQIGSERERELTNVVIDSLYFDDHVPTREEIRDEVERLLETRKFKDVVKSDADSITEIIVRNQQITKADPRIVVDNEAGFEEWFPRFREENAWAYYASYHDFLRKNSSLPQKAIVQNDKETNQILRLCENPLKEGAWVRKGMVVGHVQSGKTANYIGLLSKAADAGYKIIIILTGTLNDLRRQTQLRLDGWIEFHKSSVTYRETPYPTRWTTAEKDFSRSSVIAQQASIDAHSAPILLAIKKNGSTLKQLHQWLKRNSVAAGAQAITSPLLLIDDEADYASVNTKARDGDENNPSAINRGIRSILSLFERRTYVGYTATPFANIFIDPESTSQDFKHDLFPSDFIVNLEAPSNYFGPDFLFGQQTDEHDVEDSPSPYIRRIADPNDELLPVSHKKDFEPRGLREDLVEAMRTFLIALTIRKLREPPGFPASMLVHASRFTVVQLKLADEIRNQKSRMEEAFDAYGSLEERDALRDPIIKSFQETFHREYDTLANVPEWAEIQHALTATLRRTEVRTINSASNESLDYDRHPDGLHVIAVGGNSLSRGLTLDGLTVSYFLRNTRTYDTLMQMGRWFGYRDGYRDLCRLWISEETEGAFEHVAQTMQELRHDFDDLVRMNLPPSEFALRVRTHPDNLMMVTARNKMGNTVELDISLSNRFIETHALNDSAAARKANRAAVQRLAEELRTVSPEPLATSPSGWLYRAIGVDVVLDFISRYQNDERSIYTEYAPVTEFINNANRFGELGTWDIFFPSLKPNGTPTDDTEALTGLPIVCQLRTAGKHHIGDPETCLRIGNKQRVSSRGIERAGLSPEAIETAEHEFIENAKKKDPSKELPKNIPDLIYREDRLRPMLVIQLLEIRSSDDKEHLPDGPRIAWSISFPKVKTKELISGRYRVNASLVALLYGDSDEEEGDD